MSRGGKREGAGRPASERVKLAPRVELWAYGWLFERSLEEKISVHELAARLVASAARQAGADPYAPASSPTSKASTRAPSSSSSPRSPRRKPASSPTSKASSSPTSPAPKSNLGFSPLGRQYIRHISQASSWASLREVRDTISESHYRQGTLGAVELESLMIMVQAREEELREKASKESKRGSAASSGPASNSGPASTRRKA